MEIFDKVTRIVKDDMSVEIKKGSKLSRFFLNIG